MGDLNDILCFRHQTGSDLVKILQTKQVTSLEHDFQSKKQ